MSPPKKAMSGNLPPPPPPHLNHKVPVPFVLHKAKSWSPNIHQEEAWRRQKKNHLRSTSKTTTLTDSDLDELRACFELGFAFDSSSELDPKLSKTFPALEFYHDVLNKKFTKNLSRSSSLPSLKNRDFATKKPKPIVEPGDDPETVKMKLRHWAQVVACSVHIHSPK